MKRTGADRRLTIGFVCALALAAACSSRPVDQGVTVDQLIAANKSGRVRCGDVVVVRGTTVGASPHFDVRRITYPLSSTQGTQISVDTEANSWPTVGPTVLVKGRLDCARMLNPDGTSEASWSLWEMDRRIDIPPGTVTLK
jgi:hypothetical protein